MITKIGAEFLKRMSRLSHGARELLRNRLNLQDVTALTSGLTRGANNILARTLYTPVDVGGMTFDQYKSAYTSLVAQLKAAKDAAESERLQDAILFLIRAWNKVKANGYQARDSYGFTTDIMPKLVHVENANLSVDPGNTNFLKAFMRHHEANESLYGEMNLMEFYRNRAKVIERAKKNLNPVLRQNIDLYADKSRPEYNPVRIVDIANDRNFYYDSWNVDKRYSSGTKHDDIHVPLADRKFLDRRLYLDSDDAFRYILEGKLNSGEHQLLNSLAKYYPALSTHNLADSPGNVRNAMRAKAKSFEAGEWKYTNRKR